MIHLNKKSSAFFILTICLVFFGIWAVSLPGFAGVDSDEKTYLWTSIIYSYLNGSGGFCWFCPIFGTLFDAMNNLATAVSVKLSGVFLMLMGVGLLFSIAFKVGKMVTQLQPVELMQFLTDLFKHLGRAIIATALLVSSLSIFTYLVSPILSMSLNLSSIIMDEGGGRGSIVTGAQSMGIQINDICAEYKNDMTAIPDFGTQTKAFTPDVKASMLCSLKTMSAGLLFGISVGAGIYALALVDTVWVFPNPIYVLLGVILILIHLIILISFPFKLIDAMMRLAFVCALMPLWIILWVFPATVGYTKKAWDMFVSSCLIFVCLSVIIVLAMTMVSSGFGNKEEIIAALENGYDKRGADLIKFGGKEFLVTCAMCYIAWKMLGTATILANSFTGNMPDLKMGEGLSQFTVKGAQVAGGATMNLGQKGMDKLGLDKKTVRNATGWTAATILTGGGALVAGGLWEGLKFGKRKLWDTKSNADGSTTVRTNQGRDAWTEETKDANGRLTARETQMPNGANRKEEFDPDTGVRTQTTATDAAGNKTQIQYDKSGTQIMSKTQTSADGKRQEVTQYRPDGSQETTKTVSSDTGDKFETTEHADAQGNVTAREESITDATGANKTQYKMSTEANGDKKERVYDAQGKETHTITSQKDGGYSMEDATGKVAEKRVVEADGSSRYTFYDDGGKVKEQQVHKNGNVTAFDEKGQPISNPKEKPTAHEKSRLISKPK